LNGLTERLYSVVAQLEGLGVARSADDVRAIAEGLCDIPDGALPAEDARIGVSIEKVTRICDRLVRGGLARSADDLGRVLDDLKRLHGSPPSP
jgi:hypothetical protein